MLWSSGSWAAAAAVKGGKTTYLGRERIKAAGATSALVFVLSNHPYVSGKHYERKLCRQKQCIFSGVLVIFGHYTSQRSSLWCGPLYWAAIYRRGANLFIPSCFHFQTELISLVRIAPWWHILSILTRLASSAPSFTAATKMIAIITVYI